MRPRVYLDACCLSRLTDDQSQPRIRAEAEAVEQIFKLIDKQLLIWISSTILVTEVNRNKNVERRAEARSLLLFATEVFVASPAAANRAQIIQRMGFSAFDSLHLACAEQAKADVFLTTDDALVRRATLLPLNQLSVKVQNPVLWYQGVHL